jgi:hypothetical protein
LEKARHGHFPHAPTGVRARNHHQVLAANGVFEDPAIPSDRDVIGDDHAGHDRLAEAPRGVDDHRILVAAHRIDGEGNERNVAVNELLDHDGDIGGVLRQPTVAAIRDRPV